MSLRPLCIWAISGAILLIAPQILPQTPSQTPSQTPATPSNDTQLSPRAAYEDALHPLEITRHDIANWSDIEIAAMKVAIARAKEACLARQAGTYTGADLLELARLCSLGQQWSIVATAANRYISEPATPKPRLTEAYVDKVDADLRMKAEEAALADATTMLSAVPYTADVADAIDEALGYMQFVHTADALTLAKLRLPFLLDALRAPAPASPSGGTPGSPALIPVHQLYAEGIALAALQQLSAQPAAASTTIAALDGALPAALNPDDAQPMAAERRRYSLLGKPLTGVHPLASLSEPRNNLPAIPAPRSVTALLLFPDWCASCIRMGPHLPETVVAVEGHSAYIYALLAQTVPPRKPDPKVTNAAFDPSLAAATLAETPTVTVAPDTPDHFAARDFPFLILVDANGIVRLLQPAAAEDVLPGGSLDAAIAVVGRNFPLAAAALLPPKTQAGSPKP